MTSARPWTRHLSRLTARWTADAAEAALDEGFYTLRYPDLRHLGSRRQLIEHYRRHGRGEGRHTSLAAALAALARQGRHLPGDFDANLYRALNPDLQRVFTEDWQYTLHFLESGRDEGRAYRRAAPEPEPGWASLFDLSDFLLFTAAWRPPGDLTRAAALALFEAEGVARLTPLARGWAFDAAFYRASCGFAPSAPAALYRHWLDGGFAAGHAPNEARALLRFVGERPYPACFDWRAYLGLPADAPAFPHRVRALARLFDRPFEPRAEAAVAGTGAGRLYADIGAFHGLRGYFRDAIPAYEAAMARGVDDAAIHFAHAEALRHLGDRPAAARAYRRAVERPPYPVQAVVRAATMAMAEGRLADGYALLAGEQARWAGHADFAAGVDDALQAAFRHIWARAGTRLGQDGGDGQDGCDGEGAAAQVQAEAADALADLVAAVAVLKVGHRPRVLPRGRRVAMLACLDLPQCTHYRVTQKREQLQRHGIALEVFGLDEAEAFMAALPGAAQAIAYRVPAFPKVIEALLYARALGIATFYDIDDLLFTPDFPDTFESYEGQITRETYRALQRDVPFIRQAVTLCDHGLASTATIARAMEPLVRGGTASVVPNGLDSAHAAALAIGAAPRAPAGALTIFYGSGTKAHNADFNDLAGPALCRLMARHPTLRLCIVGHLRLAPAFDAFAARIVRIPFVADPTRYWALLSACDIAIAVLRPGRVADAKSAIKWLEAAAVGVPCVVSRTATYAATVTPGVDGLLADDADEWFAALDGLIADGAARAAMARAARATALRRFGLETTADALVAALAAGSARGVPQAADGRLRVLIVHVFFAPQTCGGATRVVEGNVDAFVARHGDALAISILATDVGAPAGRLRVEDYRGCPVYRLGTTPGRDRDRHAFDPDLRAPLGRVLDLARPDLVHIHCIQRLTATVVEETARRAIPYLVTPHDAWWIADHQFLVDGDDRPVPIDADAFATVLPPGVERLASIERRQRLRALLAGAARVLPVSDAFAALHRAAGVANLTVVANGLPALPPPLPATTPADRLVLGHIGGNSVHKGVALIEMVLRANRFAGLELLLIDANLQHGEEVVTVWGATTVRRRGQVPQAAIAALFADFDVLLAPSIWPESFGLVTREAAFYRKWVVASDRGAMGADVVEGVTGFRIDVGDPADLARVLALMAADPARFKRLAGPCPALRSSEDQADDLARLYRTVAAPALQPEAGA